MSENRFIQLHFLTSFSASLLNRDDMGLAKRLPYGGATRTRVSSQCLKRHWRTHEGPHSLRALGIPDAIRSRLTFEQRIARPLIEEGLDEAIVRPTLEAVMDLVLGKSAKAEKKKSKKDEEQHDESHGLATGQVTVLGEPEVEFLKQQVAAIAREVDGPKAVAKAVKERFDAEARKNLGAMAAGCGLSAALFGRMVTSDILARTDAAVHVAHAFTVHAESAEPDYFSAVDDLAQQAGESGSGHINSTELTSGLFYGYVVVDVPLLVSNLEGIGREHWREVDRGTSAKVVQELVHLIATVSPGAKLGATAPYAYADLLLAEVTSAQPRSFAAAFQRPVAGAPDVRANAYHALDTHLAELDGMYTFDGARALAARGLDSSLTALAPVERLKLDQLASWVGAQVTE